MVPAVTSWERQHWGAGTGAGVPRGRGREGRVAEAGLSRALELLRGVLSPWTRVLSHASAPRANPNVGDDSTCSPCGTRVYSALTTQTRLSTPVHSTRSDAFHTVPQDARIRSDTVPSGSDRGSPPSVGCTDAVSHTPQSAVLRQRRVTGEPRVGPGPGRASPSRPPSPGRPLRGRRRRSPALRSGRQPAARARSSHGAGPSPQQCAPAAPGRSQCLPLRASGPLRAVHEPHPPGPRSQLLHRTLRPQSPPAVSPRDRLSRRTNRRPLALAPPRELGPRSAPELSPRPLPRPAPFGRRSRPSSGPVVRVETRRPGREWFPSCPSRVCPPD